nr:peptidylprolyl isomerase [Suttonella ornithocola]
MKTSAGEMEIELNENEAPKTVDNFLRYVKEGFYNGTTFHRVIKGFMIQGGGYDVNYEKRPTRGPIASETQNGLKNDRGTIAMARTSDPHSATSQFFINVVNNDFLNPGGADAYGYTVFGKVIKGMDVADKIAALPTTAAGPFSQDVPEKPVIIESIKILPEAENSADKK